MARLTGSWSPAETVAFLDEMTVPVRVACRTPSGHLWMLSLWYRREDEADPDGTDPDGDEVTAPTAVGTINCATGADADVVRYLRADPAVAFEISTNRPPYRGVRGRGTASIEPDEDKALLRALIERYLGGTDSTLAERLLAPEREEVRIRIDPARLHTWDYSERMRDATGETVDAGDGPRE